MHARTRRATTWRSVATCLSFTLGALLAGAPAQAAGPRPLFQMPFACGQTWEASTYDGHWPNQNSIDLGEWDALDNNVGSGEPVLATADGTVLDVFTDGAGGHRVYIDHGGGWVTHYLHLEQVPPLTKGQAVAQGEQIGRVGNSGTEAMHLHYTQLADGQAVQIEFNGTPINTGAANQATWNTWGNGEKLTSLNCPMHTFAETAVAGDRLQFQYKPGTGKAAIRQFATDGQSSSAVWSDTWTKGWTHFVPFVLNGQPHVIAYKSSSGTVNFDRINPGGTGVTTIGAGTWTKGITHFMPFTLGGQPYYISYSSLYGWANVDRINAAGNGATNVWAGSWGKGLTNLAPFVLNGVQYFIAYHGGAGAVEIDKITGAGNSVAITEVWSSTWAKGWTHLVPVTHNGAVHLIFYKATSGYALLTKINPGGQGIQTLAIKTWSKDWTTFSPFTVAGQGHLQAYQAGTGQVNVLKLSAVGDDLSLLTTISWTSGWA